MAAALVERPQPSPTLPRKRPQAGRESRLRARDTVIARLDPGDPVNTDREYWIARSSRAMTPIGSA
jgi:hypothetical protein